MQSHVCATHVRLLNKNRIQVSGLTTSGFGLWKVEVVLDDLDFGVFVIAFKSYGE